MNTIAAADCLNGPLVAIGKSNAHVLVNTHDPVSLGQDLVHDRMDAGHRFAAVLAVAVEGGQLHRAGTVERVGGDEVFETVWLDLYEQLLHSTGLKLEDALGLAAAEQGEDVFVGEIDALDVNLAVGEQGGGAVVFGEA